MERKEKKYYIFSHLKRPFSQVHYEVGEMRTTHKIVLLIFNFGRCK